jgi:acetyltransferase-like isoleucine patch superfamily enzyme
MRVMLVTSSHAVGPCERRAGPLKPAPITVGDGCWIGAGAVLLPGVTVHDGCVIASGAVVTGDCAADGLYAGVPARRVRDL